MKKPKRCANMKDGVYQVTTNYLCAGFIIKDGRLVDCAPILRNRISYWMSIAKWICDYEPKQ